MESVVRVLPRDNYQLEIEFSTGEVRLFDVRPYLDRGIFTKLKDRALFARAFVACDTVCWPNDLDIAPETLYVKSVPILPVVHETPEKYGESF